MSSSEQVWWRPEGRSPFALDPDKPFWPQIISIVWQSLIIFGGPVIGLVTINYYPFLIQDRTIYIGGLASIVFWFLASFAIYGNDDFPRGMPQQLKLVFRAGYGLCMSFLLLGLAGIANGYNTPVIARDVAVVAKHTTRHSDPARRTYYVAMRAWPPSRAVVELNTPRDVYDRLRVRVTAIDTPQKDLQAMADSGSARLILGEGRLGLEWLKRIELP
jgi:energy-converting hydrogenase Eha subunit A